MILGDGLTIRSQFYEDWSLLLDEEKNLLFSTAVRGLSSILFAINIDKQDLNCSLTSTSSNFIKQHSDPLPVVIINSSDNETRKARHRRLPRVNVVNLSDEETNSLSERYFLKTTSNSEPNSFSQQVVRPAILSDSFLNRDWSSQDQASQSEGEAENFENLASPAKSNLLLTPIGNDNLSIGESLMANCDDEAEVAKNNENNLKDSSSDQLSSNPSKEGKSSSSESLYQGSVGPNEAEADETMKKQYQEKITKLELQTSELGKENEMLKLQLKKYISAIQLLQPDAKELIEKFTNIEINFDENSSNVYQYYQESMEYEKKLIQVAEMHGELVEFNDRLHKMILHRDSTIKRLKNELIELRGPVST